MHQSEMAMNPAVQPWVLEKSSTGCAAPRGNEGEEGGRPSKQTEQAKRQTLFKKDDLGGGSADV